MCSIAGRYAVGVDAAAAARVRAMIEVMAHRGPDGRHVAAFGPVVLGHGRLAIRDRSERARQPMATPDGRFVLTFNGEIYNHADLRRDLEAEGVRVVSHGDTEVLLHALARWGEDVLPRLDGDFALAFLDRESGRLLLARDPYGVKPLCFVEAADGFWFASEPTALLAPAGPAPRRADEASVARYFVEGVMDEGDRTFYRDVRSLPACHRMVVEGGRIVARGPYRRFPHDEPRARDVRATLERAVALRLEADVAVGLSLSGGLDSGTLAGLAARAHGPGLPTFTAAMPDPALDESAVAAEVAKAARANPTFTLVTAPRVEDVHALLREMGAPTGTFSELARRDVVRTARASGVKVLLDGQGADEVFGGYPHFQAARLADLMKGLRLARLAREARHAPPGALKEAAYFLLPRRARSLLRRLAHRRARALLDRGLARRHPLPPAAAAPAHGSHLKAALAESLTSRSLPCLLRYADRTTMAEGVEGRYPYLAPDVVSAAFALPDDALVSDGWTKRALRAAAADVTPPSVHANRRKVDFRTPNRAWLTGSLADAFREHLTDGRLEARGWLAPGAGARLHARFLEGRDGGLAIRAFLLEAWARACLDTVPAPAAARSPTPAPAASSAPTPAPASGARPLGLTARESML